MLDLRHLGFLDSMKLGFLHQYHVQSIEFIPYLMLLLVANSQVGLLQEVSNGIGLPVFKELCMLVQNEVPNV